MKSKFSILFLAISLLFSLKIFAQNVGIGTTTPLMKLQVSKNDSAVAIFENTQVLATNVSNAIYFKTGSWYSGAIKSIGTGTNVSRVGLFSYASSNANGLREYLSVEDDGNVGIGVTNPAFILDVNGRMQLRYNGNTSGIWLNKADNTQSNFFGNYNDSIIGNYTTYGGGWQFFFDHKNGYLGFNNAAPKVPISFPASVGKKLSLYPGSNGDAGFDVWGNELRIHSDYSGADITFGYDTYSSAAGGNFAERMRIKGTGQVCIGTTQVANGYILNVGGKAIAEEVRVQLRGAWPDYVFDKKYSLKSLPELESYINTNNHLPNVPAAAEVQKSGIELGEMQKKMMEKIEELSLYVIDLQKQISKLKDNKDENHK